MPAYWTSSSSSSSLSSYSGGSSRKMQAIDTMLMTFSEYLEQFESNNAYTNLMVTLFERQDLIIKKNEMKHLAGMVEHFQNEISHLQEYIQEYFDTMEAGGLHQLLKKRFVCHGGVMERWPELRFDLPSENDRPSTIWRPSTPYPRDRIPSPQIKKPIHCLQYSPTASQYSPTASQYRTPPESPKPEPSLSRLSPTFIPEVLFPNPDFHPTFDGQSLEEQYLELSTDEIKNCQGIDRQIDAQVQGLERWQVDWMNYQGGIGTWYNPIIIEDDWFRESLDVRGVMLRFFSFLIHVEHAFLISISLLTCFFSSLFHEHVLSLDYSFLLQHVVYTLISYMRLTGLLHMFSMPLTWGFTIYKEANISS